MNIPNEEELFHGLGVLCQSPGYVHVIAFFCWRDDFVNAYASESWHSEKGLIRTEVSTLIGLMTRADIDRTLPSPQQFQTYIDRTEALLLDLHHILMHPLKKQIGMAPSELNKNEPVWSGQSLREPIFYSGDSAYNFQYVPFAIDRYRSDSPWLLDNMGFEISDAAIIVRALGDLIPRQLEKRLDEFGDLPPDQWTVLESFAFSVDALQKLCGSMDPKRLEAILSAFSLESGNFNSRFTSLQEFNAVTAFPLLPWGDRKYLLLQSYMLAEALYEAPVFWLMHDKSYSETAKSNRGLFTEALVAGCLEKVFGDECVFRNVDIYSSSSKRVGEIDVLVVYGGRAIVVQAKSKRLTMEARKGNDQQIKSDFEKAVQHAANQGFQCSKALQDECCILKDKNGFVLDIKRSFQNIQPVCIVSDHYPALALQVRQFLTSEKAEKISVPLVMDVFALDAVAEMLSSPLHFLSYLEIRTRIAQKFMASNEIALLGCYLSHGLWFDKTYNLVMLQDDLSASVDVAMAVRRAKIPGPRTPEGTLTRLNGTPLGNLVLQAENSKDPLAIELGMRLLQLSGAAVDAINAGLENLVRATKYDRSLHDLSFPFDDTQGGLTLHCGYSSDGEARLITHCRLAKYRARANAWFGLLVRPEALEIEVCVGNFDSWKFDSQMERAVKELPAPRRIVPVIHKNSPKKRLGRNDLCSCGSGRKYKKCCLRS